MDGFIKLRDTFRETADILDEFIALEEKEKSGQDISKESEAILGRFMMKMIILQQLQEEL